MVYAAMKKPGNARFFLVAPASPASAGEVVLVRHRVRRRGCRAVTIRAGQQIALLGVVWRRHVVDYRFRRLRCGNRHARTSHSAGVTLADSGCRRCRRWHMGGSRRCDDGSRRHRCAGWIHGRHHRAGGVCDGTVHVCTRCDRLGRNDTWLGRRCVVCSWHRTGCFGSSRGHWNWRQGGQVEAFRGARGHVHRRSGYRYAEGRSRLTRFDRMMRVDRSCRLCCGRSRLWRRRGHGGCRPLWVAGQTVVGCDGGGSDGTRCGDGADHSGRFSRRGCTCVGGILGTRRG